MTSREPRDELAAALRALRIDAGISTTELARQLGWSQSTVSRIERGVTAAKPSAVNDWTRALRATPELREHLVDLAEQQLVEFIEWKRAMAPGRRRLQEEIKELEGAASVLYEFSMDVIPGLVQTGTYAEAMFTLGDDSNVPNENLVEIVQARLARQVVLNNKSKKFNLLFTETALRRSLLAINDMREQISRVIEVARMPNVTVGVIPFSARENDHTYLSFAVWGDPNLDKQALVSAETLTRRLRIRTPDEVRAYINHYNNLAAAAIYGDDLIKFLREISADAPWS